MLIVIGVLAVVAAGVGMALALYFEKHQAVATVDFSKAHTGQWQGEAPTLRDQGVPHVVRTT